MLHALKIGYRHIDAALAYGWGSVERDKGEAIRKSGVTREELFIVTTVSTPLSTYLWGYEFEEPWIGVWYGCQSGDRLDLVANHHSRSDTLYTARTDQPAIAYTQHQMTYA